MKLILVLPLAVMLTQSKVTGEDKIGQDPDSWLTVPIFRDVSSDSLSPVFYQGKHLSRQPSANHSRRRRQLYNIFSNPYTENRGAPFRPDTSGQDIFIRRRHRGGGGFPRRGRGGGGPVIWFGRPGLRGGRRAGARGGASRGARGGRGGRGGGGGRGRG